MIKAVRLLGPIIYRIALSARQPLSCSSRASISTNSAIQRGLRKTTSTGRNAWRTPRRDEQQANRSFRKETDERPRIPRPNHLHKQDVEDMKEAAKARESARSPRQLRYLEGGRRAPSLSNKSIFPETNFRDRRRGERTARGSQRATDRYARDKPPSFATPASDKPNRAARRAAIYGPGDTPPQRVRDSRINLSSRSRSRTFEREDRNSTPWHTARGRYETPERPLTTSEESHMRYDERREKFPRVKFRSTSSDSSGFASEERRPYARRSRDDERSATASDVPVAIPYTTPASEFLYGTSVVSAALKFSRRKFYKLYTYSAPDRVNVSQDTALRNLASSKGVEVMQVQGEWLRIMDKMSTGRPHNVIALLKPTDSVLNR